MVKPFRFGVQSFNADSGEEWASKARKAEALQLTSLLEGIACHGQLALALIQ